jgi:twitching motility two-component system response regulator PilG
METSSQQHIMVIDDSPTVCKILEISLKRAGFSVVCFRDPVEALIALGDASTPLPDLLLLDVLLPRMDGFEVMQYLCHHADLSDIPVVLMSRKNGTIDRLKARLAGAVAYIPKPFEMARVISVVCEQSELQLQKGERRQPAPTLQSGERGGKSHE